MKTDKKVIFGLIASSFLLYLFSMCIKMAYSASLVQIIEEYGVSKTVASTPLTLYYVFYAVIQLFLAVIMSKINVKRYMTVTYVLSGLLFVSVFFYSPMWYLGAVLALLGITLGAVWCGIVFYYARFLTGKQMNDALMIMGVGFSVGSALSYVISAITMKIGNWRYSFLITGLLFIAATAYYIFSITRAEKSDLKITADGDGGARKSQVYQVERHSAKSLVIMAVITIFFVSLLYYAISNWMPTILKNVFGLENSEATLISTVFVMVVFVGPVMANVVSNKMKNDFLLSVLMAAAIVLISVAMYLWYDVNVALTVIIMGVSGIISKFILSLFCSVVSLHTRDYFNSGKTASITNSSACVAAAVAPTLIAMIVDLSDGDWGTGFLALIIIAAVSFVIPLGFLVAYYKRRSKPFDETKIKKEIRI